MYKSIEEIKQANKKAGGRFFDDDKTVPLDEVFQGQFIVTPDEDFYGNPEFNIWAVQKDARIIHKMKCRDLIRAKHYAKTFGIC